MASLRELRAKSMDDKQSGDAEGKQAASKPTNSRSLLRGRLESQVPTQQIEPMQQQASSSGRLDLTPSEMENELNFNRILVDRYRQLGEGEQGLVPKAGFSDIAYDGRAMELGVPSQWVETGGLSLPINLPTAGQTLTFTKLGGDPQLRLSVRPVETGTTAIRWLWAIVVLIAGAWLLHQLAHDATIDHARRGLVLSLIAVGLIALLFLPQPWSLLGGVLLVIGCAVGLHHSQQVHEQRTGMTGG